VRYVVSLPFAMIPRAALKPVCVTVVTKCTDHEQEAVELVIVPDTGYDIFLRSSQAHKYELFYFVCCLQYVL
jgi:hypothetical protein